MPQKNLLVSVMLLVIGAVIGFGASRFVQTTAISPAEFEKMKHQIEQAKKLFPSLPDDVRSFSGIVRSVSGTTLSLEVKIVSPFEDLPNPRTVMISDRTNIVRIKQKDQASYQKELDAFNAFAEKPVKPGSTAPVYPSPNEEVPASTNDIKSGMNVTVTANENIHTAASFTAATVAIDSVQFSSSTPNP